MSLVRKYWTLQSKGTGPKICLCIFCSILNGFLKNECSLRQNCGQNQNMKDYVFQYYAYLRISVLVNFSILFTTWSHITFLLWNWESERKTNLQEIMKHWYYHVSVPTKCFHPTEDIFYITRNFQGIIWTLGKVYQAFSFNR